MFKMLAKVFKGKSFSLVFLKVTFFERLMFEEMISVKVLIHVKRIFFQITSLFKQKEHKQTQIS